MLLLVQFLSRLSFGLAAAMLAVSPRQVTSGYYRNNSYVLLGLNTLAALVLLLTPQEGLYAWPAALAAVAGYLAAASWLYEKAGPGLLALAIAAIASLAGAALNGLTDLSGVFVWLQWLHLAGSAAGGAVLGVTLAAMLLGHWYLNVPGMSLAPLFRLIHLMIAALAVRAAVAVPGLFIAWLDVESGKTIDTSFWLFLCLRWLTGIFSALVVAVMARETLKVPNTQSATGILYVGVILTFIGELTSLLLSRGQPFPI